MSALLLAGCLFVLMLLTGLGALRTGDVAYLGFAALFGALCAVSGALGASGRRRT